MHLRFGSLHLSLVVLLPLRPRHVDANEVAFDVLVVVIVARAEIPSMAVMS